MDIGWTVNGSICVIVQFVQLDAVWTVELEMPVLIDTALIGRGDVMTLLRDPFRMDLPAEFGICPN